MIFTIGSVSLIGFLANYFNKSILFRISGALLGAIFFFILTNFGVWIGGMYGYNLQGLVNCYLLALPFFAYTFISTLLFSCLIEAVYKISYNKFIKIKM